MALLSGTVNELALFAGAGGGLLGSRLLGWRTVCAVENNLYRQAVLLARQEDGQLDPFPIWSDVHDFDGCSWRGCVDIITAGFPCQPFSVAGKQRGEDDERNLWPETVRVIREVGPRYALLENVPGLLVHPYFGTILGDLAESGYRVRWDCIPASAVGANHQRDRLWIVGDAKGREAFRGHARALRLAGSGEDVADAASTRTPAEQQSGQLRCPEQSGTDVPDAELNGPQRAKSTAGATAEMRRRLAEPSWWAVEPDVGRVADGVAARVDRLAALGDGQVPPVVRAAWRLLGPQPSDV